MGIVQKNLIGIEIGAKNVKLVKMNAKGKATNYAYVDLPDNVILNGRVESKQMLTETLKLARKKLDISFKDCVLCLDNTDVIIRQMTIPQMEEEYIRKNIALELSGFLPVSADRYVIDYIIADKIDTEPKQYQLLVYAVPSDVINSYAACIKAAGFSLRYIDIMENAYEKLFKMFRKTKVTSENNFACLYIDNSKASVSVFGNGKFFINKTIDNGISKICKEIADKTNRQAEAVRSLIFTNDVLGVSDAFTVEKTVIERNMKDITIDVMRVVDYFKSRNPESAIGTVYLSGGFSHLTGAQQHLQNLLGIPVITVSGYLDKMFREAPTKNNGVDYTNAIAVTLREENSL
ncbi:MAG: pilus assembly protein PilM [Saccharofermentanales bacterium]